MSLFLMNFLLILVPVLVNVAFVTLYERKILGLAQSRKGPAKVGVSGLGQPFADAVKLFLKTDPRPSQSFSLIFVLAPTGAIVLALCGWALMPLSVSPWPLGVSLLWLIAIMGLGLYPLLMAGWSSNSPYASTGALRGVAQTIAYEVSLALCLMSILSVSRSVSLVSLTPLNTGASYWVVLPLVVLLLISCVAETNRTPFDFAEGESELVSGFNVEYAAGKFVLIFMAEYASILLLSTLVAVCAFIGPGSAALASTSVAVAGGWMWLRATLPRYRYDKLMSVAWKSLLPETLFLLLLALTLNGGI